MRHITLRSFCQMLHDFNKGAEKSV